MRWLVLAALAAIGLGLGGLWLLGEIMIGLGMVAVSTAALLTRLILFVLVGSFCSGAVYVVASAWRPAATQVPLMTEPRTKVYSSVTSNRNP